MNDLQGADVRRAGILRSRVVNAAACLVVAGTLAASIGTQLVLHPEDGSPVSGRRQAGLLDSDFQLLAVPHPDRANRQPEDRVITASATTDDEISGPRRASQETTGEVPGADPDQGHRQVITGNWYDEYRGKRQLTVRADGTGTMIVEPDGIGKRLFAAKLTFDIEWSIADGRVTLKMLGGEPKSKVQLILKIYGQEADYTILELNEDRLLLLDADGKTCYDWRRTETASERRSPDTEGQ